MKNMGRHGKQQQEMVKEMISAGVNWMRVCLHWEIKSRRIRREMEDKLLKKNHEQCNKMKVKIPVKIEILPVY